MLEALEDRETVEVRRGVELEALDRRADGVVAYVRRVAGGPSASRSRRAGSSAATAARARCARGCRSLRGQDGAAAVDRRRRAGRPAAAQGPAPALRRARRAPARDAADVPRSPPLGVDAAPRRGPGAVPRSRGCPRRDRTSGSTARPCRSSALSPTPSTRAPPHGGGRGACCWRATPRTSCRRSPDRASRSGARDAANLAWKLEAVVAARPRRLLDTYEQSAVPTSPPCSAPRTSWARSSRPSTPRRVRVRDALLQRDRRHRAHRMVATNVKPLPTYGAGAFAERPHRLPPRRTVGALFPQTDRLDDRLPQGLGGSRGRRRRGARCSTARASRSSTPALTVGGSKRGPTWDPLLRPDRFVFAAEGTQQPTVAGAFAAPGDVSRRPSARRWRA